MSNYKDGYNSVIKLARLHLAPTAGGAVLGGGTGYAASPEEHKIKGTLLGAAGGAGAGHLVGRGHREYKVRDLKGKAEPKVEEFIDNATKSSVKDKAYKSDDISFDQTVDIVDQYRNNPSAPVEFNSVALLGRKGLKYEDEVINRIMRDKNLRVSGSKEEVQRLHPEIRLEEAIKERADKNAEKIIQDFIDGPSLRDDFTVSPHVSKLDNNAVVVNDGNA